MATGGYRRRIREIYGFFGIEQHDQPDYDKILTLVKDW